MTWKFTCHLIPTSLKVGWNRVGSVQLRFNSPQYYSRMAAQLKHVYVTRPDVAPIGLELLKADCNISTWTEEIPVPRDELLRQIEGKDALFCALTDKIDAEVIERAGPQLKCISTISVGYEHIDLDACKKHNIRVGYTPDVLTDATAELTLALLLATNRRLFEANKEVYNGGWKSWAPNWMCGQGLKGSCVGIFGFGRIGQEVAARIKPFKPRRLTYTSRTKRPAEAAPLEAVDVSFDEMLQESDFIIVCCSLTPETKEIFNTEAFAKMKKNAIFINTARGGIVDQKALYKALKEKCIQAAGLDVTTPEPLPLDDPLLTLNNVVILPHIGSADINTRVEMSRITAFNILAALKGQRMIAEVLFDVTCRPRTSQTQLTENYVSSHAQPVDCGTTSKTRGASRCPTCNGTLEHKKVNIPEKRVPWEPPHKSWNFKIRKYLEHQACGCNVDSKGTIR